MQVTLSYTTLNELILCPHTWLNKLAGLPRFVSPAMIAGKEAHRVIQAHVSGVKEDPRLAKVKCKFSVVEQFEMDERMHFVMPIRGDFYLHGYLDGYDPDGGRMLEIKTSSNPWGLGKFYQLMQWRVYALAHPELKEVWFITGTKDLTKVDVFGPILITEKNRQEAKDWIEKGISIIESGDFSYTGIGKSPYCNYIGCKFCQS